DFVDGPDERGANRGLACSRWPAHEKKRRGHVRSSYRAAMSRSTLLRRRPGEGESSLAAAHPRPAVKVWALAAAYAFLACNSASPSERAIVHTPPTQGPAVSVAFNQSFEDERVDGILVAMDGALLYRKTGDDIVVPAELLSALSVAPGVHTLSVR